MLAEAPEDLSIAGETVSQRVEEEEVTTARQEPTRPTDTILQFYRHWFFTASRTPVARGGLPAVTVHQTLPSGDSLLLGSITSPALQAYLDSRPTFRPSLFITDLQLDLSTSESSTSILHLAVFYSTGQFNLFHLSLPTPTSPFSYTEVHTHLALSTTGPMSSTFDPVVLARFHLPLLVTCSRAFVLRFWRVEGSKVEEVEPSLKSRESWAPVVLTLKRETRVVEEEEDEEDEWGMRRLMGESVGKELPELEEEEVFRVTLAYSTPVFPEGWSVGVQEFVVRIPPAVASLPSASLLDRAFHRARVSITARHAIAPPTTSFHLSPSPHRRHQSSLVTSLEYSTPYLVASKADNTLDVFQLVSFPPPPPTRLPSAHQHLHLRTDLTPQEGKLHLVHRRTLFGHTSRVTSVAVEEGGRCVSGGDDGVVKVWQLAGDEGRERAVDVVEEGVEAARERSVWEVMKERRGVKSRVGSGERREGGTKRIKRVYFDEDKIVSIVAGAGAGGEEVRVLRFD